MGPACWGTDAQEGLGSLPGDNQKSPPNFSAGLAGTPVQAQRGPQGRLPTPPPTQAAETTSTKCRKEGPQSRRRSSQGFFGKPPASLQPLARQSSQALPDSPPVSSCSLPLSTPPPCLAGWAGKLTHSRPREAPGMTVEAPGTSKGRRPDRSPTCSQANQKPKGTRKAWVMTPLPSSPVRPPLQVPP